MKGCVERASVSVSTTILCCDNSGCGCVGGERYYIRVGELSKRGWDEMVC